MNGTPATTSPRIAITTGHRRRAQPAPPSRQHAHRLLDVHPEGQVLAVPVTMISA
jgi:hypothetical protein